MDKFLDWLNMIGTSFMATLPSWLWHHRYYYQMPDEQFIITHQHACILISVACFFKSSRSLKHRIVVTRHNICLDHQHQPRGGLPLQSESVAS